eukprot:1166424-Rhodomonas_salina.1
MRSADVGCAGLPRSRHWHSKLCLCHELMRVDAGAGGGDSDAPERPSSKVLFFRRLRQRPVLLHPLPSSPPWPSSATRVRRPPPLSLFTAPTRVS